MGQTATYALPWPELGTTADAPAALQSLANATESAMKRTRGWFARRTQNDDVASSAWGDICGLTVPTAPAGDYLVTSVLYWWAGTANRESIYTWHGVNVSGVEVFAMSVGGISGDSDKPNCSVIQYLYTVGAGAGSVTFRGRFGFSVQGIRAFNGSSLSVVRVTDA